MNFKKQKIAKAVCLQLAKQSKEFIDPSHTTLFGESFYCAQRNELLKEFLINQVEGDMLLLTTKSLIERLKDHSSIKSSLDYRVNHD